MEGRSKEPDRGYLLIGKPVMGSCVLYRDGVAIDTAMSHNPIAYQDLPAAANGARFGRLVRCQRQA